MTDLEKSAIVIPVDDMDLAVEIWGQLLGVPPTFVDGDKWSQFDAGVGRVCLAGTDRNWSSTAGMFKTQRGRLEEAAQTLERLGFSSSAVEHGEHERRCVLTGGSDVTVVLYESLDS